MGNDRDLFDGDPSGLPVYEGRMVAQYDHRAKGYRSGRGRAAQWEDLPLGNPRKSIQAQWYISRDKIPDKARDRIRQYRLGFCDVASPTNERTLVAALIPPDTICGHKVPTILFEPEFEWVYPLWLAAANSFPMDFLARKKVSLSMSFTVLDSLPFPRPERDTVWVSTVVPYALRLICTGSEMTDYWNRLAQCGFVEPVPSGSAPPGATDEDQRLGLRAQVEAVVARDVFGLSRKELEYILETFPIVKRKDIDRYGDYRTKLTILETFDALGGTD